MRIISSFAAKPVVEVTLIEVPVGFAVTVVKIPSALVERFDPKTSVLMFLAAEIVTEPSPPVPVSKVPDSPRCHFATVVDLGEIGWSACRLDRHTACNTKVAEKFNVHDIVTVSAPSSVLPAPVHLITTIITFEDPNALSDLRQPWSFWHRGCNVSKTNSPEAEDTSTDGELL